MSIKQECIEVISELCSVANLKKGDILVVGTMKAIAFTKDKYALRHHGGYLGVLSRGEE